MGLEVSLWSRGAAPSALRSGAEGFVSEEVPGSPVRPS